MAGTRRKDPSQYDFRKQLFDEVLLPTSGSKRRSSVRTRKVRHIDIHHMTVKDSDNGAANFKCLDIWATREASAHYCVDNRYVLQAVYDNRMAWGNGNGTANQEGIIVEHANSSLAPTWGISETTLETSAKLVAGLHLTHKLGRPTSTGFGTGGTIRTHQSFFATACPGPYFKKVWSRYVGMVQAAYDAMVKGGSTPTPTPPKPTPPKPKPVGKSWFGKVISKNIGWMNDTGKAKAKSAKYRQSVVDDLVELKPFAIAVQELLGIYRDDMDKRFAKAGYERSSGSDGRYVYYRKGTKVITAGVWDLQPRYKNDDRQAAYVLLDAPHGAVLIVSGHLDHSDASGETQVRQAEDVITKGEALLRARKLPIHRAVYCLDSNSRGRVRENMIALSYYDTVRDEHRSERIDNASSYTFHGWDGKTRQNLDGIWLHTDRPCIWSGVRRRNDHLSDHRAVVAEPGLITAK